MEQRGKPLTFESVQYVHENGCLNHSLINHFFYTFIIKKDYSTVEGLHVALGLGEEMMRQDMLALFNLIHLFSTPPPPKKQVHT